MYKGNFVDVRTLTPVVRLVDLHTLVCDGYDEGQEGEEGHLEGGVDVWYGMRHLVHCIITLCIVHCHI